MKTVTEIRLRLFSNKHQFSIREKNGSEVVIIQASTLGELKSKAEASGLTFNEDTPVVSGKFRYSATLVDNTYELNRII